MKEIFKRIGQKETTKQGLQDLYNFKQRNPHADRQLEPFLVGVNMGNRLTERNPEPKLKKQLIVE